jgi:MFS family permease
MSGRQRATVGGLLLLGVLGVGVLLAFASSACPVETEAQPCPDATRNLVIGILLASLAAGLLVAPFAFLGEYVARRRIVYRGAWWRAGRRGALVGLVLATLAGLRLADALNVPVALFTIVLGGVAEWFLARRDP